jgi:hypothetical protein
MRRITTLSITKQLSDLMKKYKLSPSECLRIGVIISVYEKGKGFNNPGNAERLELLRLEKLKALEFHRQQIKLLGGSNGI